MKHSNNAIQSRIEYSGLNLLEINDLANGECDLLSLSDDPWIKFEIDPIEKPFYIIEVSSSYEFRGNEFKIYYSFFDANGFTESQSLSFSLKNKSYLKKVVSFNGNVNAIRLDISDKCKGTGIDSIKVHAVSSIDEVASYYGLKTHPNLINKTIICTHNLSKTGAPLLAFNICKSLGKKENDVVAIALSQGEDNIANYYSKYNIPLFDLDTFYIADSPDYSQEDSINQSLSFFREYGFGTAVLNTVISAEKAKFFKANYFKTISLIHETKQTIEIHDFLSEARQAAAFSDYIVFPTEEIREGFFSLIHKIKGFSLVHPQGIYNVLTKNENVNLQNLDPRITSSKTIILGSGSVNLRKGFDLFVSCANELLERNSKADILFIWTGNCDSDTDGKIFKDRLMAQARTSLIKDSFIVKPFLSPNEYCALLEKANVFWCTSRDDTFPSVVLEAMKACVPVVAFAHTGGVDSMLKDNRGKLINNFSISQFANETLLLIQDQHSRESITSNAKQWVSSKLNFDKYIEWLKSICSKDEVIPAEQVADLFPEDTSLRLKSNEPKSNISLNDIPRIRPFKRVFDRHKHTITTILDTSIQSDNAGDYIIMDYCNDIIQKLTPQPLPHVPTHTYCNSLDALDDGIKIVCGTNLIYTHMENNIQWAMPNSLLNFRNLCFLGVGMQDIGINDGFSEISKSLLSFLFDKRNLHSVRDSFTYSRLKEIGIDNIINTSCPTMWNLSEEHCLQIPSSKAENVITTITDYSLDNESDAYMLGTLKTHYQKVYIWLQGKRDYDWFLSKNIDPTEFILIGPALANFDNILEQGNVDYVGTRLHAGIRALNKKVRSIVIAIDNRASNIAKDTQLPIIYREAIKEELPNMITSSFETHIRLPEQEIMEWKKQFHLK